MAATAAGGFRRWFGTGKSLSFVSRPDMGIHEALTPQRWNYFLALEDDVVRMSRFLATIGGRPQLILHTA